ncbi:hypothetical protein BKCO1_7200023 [Neofusicoccum parvum]|uniref:Uncharacterized protein n=1 Tax=Neofusicoccum parvum TaxID=310453 RepID=A0ACB5SNS0_9PEZI|nr:hypothetical protein BKCO1_7200023 [Neofusicoccum parvum]
MADEPTRPTETEDERIGRERFEQREKLRKERQVDEYWAKYYKEREERREEGRRKNEEQRRSADDWETRFKDGRRRLEQERATRTPEDRHNPTIDVGPADSAGDDDWEAQLAEGRRRLVELKRTNEANIKNNVRSSTTLAHRRNSTTGRPDVCFASTNSSSSPNVTSSSSGVDPEEAERARIYAFETYQIAHERNEVDRMLTAQIAEAEADISNAEARLANRREREQRERLIEGMYGAYAYDGLNTGALRGDYYSPRPGMSGVGGSLRHNTRRLDRQRSSRLSVAVPRIITDMVESKSTSFRAS